MAKTLFLSVTDVRILMKRVGLEEFNRKLGARLTEDFRRWLEFEKSSRVANYSHEGVIELMPISDSTRYTFKYVNGHPGNVKQNLPTVMGFGCLSEVATGFPLLICEMTLLTAIRTAATSAVAAKALAVDGSKTMAMIGNGAQSEFQILAFHSLLGIKSFHLYDIDIHATRRLMSNLSSKSSIEMRIFPSLESTIENCEVITTATASKKHQHLLLPSLLVPGVHINAIGGDCPGKTELDPEILEMAKVFVEFAPQARIEGEIQMMSPDFEVTELWEVLSGTAPGRTSDSDITVFDSVGFSMEDFSILSLVYELAESLEIGTAIDLIPELENPKNLFGALTV